MDREPASAPESRGRSCCTARGEFLGDCLRRPGRAALAAPRGEAAASVGEAVLDLSALPEQFLTLAQHGYPSLPAYGIAAHKGELLRSLGPKPTLFTPLHLRVREVTKMVQLIAPALRQSGQVAAPCVAL